MLCAMGIDEPDYCCVIVDFLTHIEGQFPANCEDMGVV